MTELDQRAFDALNEYVTKPLVFIVEGAIGPAARTNSNGSGTLLQTPRGRLFVLTAAHVLSDDRPSQWAVGGKFEGVDDALGAEHIHPSKEVDVGIALVRPRAVAKLAPFAAPLSVLASRGAFDSEKHRAVICGFPALYRGTEVDAHAKRATVYFEGVTYGTNVQGLDAKGRFKVLWGAWHSHDERSRERLKLKSGDSLAHPRGISGGAVWRVELDDDKSQIWEPSRVAKIIGIPSTYLEPHSFAPSVDAWRPWLLTTVAAIDADNGA